MRAEWLAQPLACETSLRQRTTLCCKKSSAPHQAGTGDRVMPVQLLQEHKITFRAAGIEMAGRVGIKFRNMCLYAAGIGAATASKSSLEQAQEHARLPEAAAQNPARLYAQATASMAKVRANLSCRTRTVQSRYRPLAARDA